MNNRKKVSVDNKDFDDNGFSLHAFFSVMILLDANGNQKEIAIAEASNCNDIA